MPGERIKKLYHSIGEVARMVGLEPHVLRYWESEFSALAPRKNRAGRRVYTDEDIRMVRRIQHLLKEEKYTIEGARQVLQQGHGEEVSPDARQELIELRAFLVDVLEKF